MKQHISKEQWDELSEEGQNILSKFFFDRYKSGDVNALMNVNINIGFLIELLGEDLLELSPNHQKTATWFVRVDNYWIYRKELADALWEVVKHKLGVSV